MTFSRRRLEYFPRPAIALCCLGVIIASSLPALAQAPRRPSEKIIHDYLANHPDQIGKIAKDYLVRHPEDVQQIVKDYLVKNPDVLQEALVEMIRKRQSGVAGNNAAPTPAPDKSAAIKSNASAIFNSPRQVTLGNAQGDVTLVEFFDYNCGFCKRALADKIALMKSDPKLKVVLKEFPVLGPGSIEAAQVAVAVRMQDPGGQKYLAFHEKLLASPHADKATALAVAGQVGLDVARIERDMASSEVNDTLAEGRQLAGALGINGTPSYVVSDQVIVGAVGLAALSDKIRIARFHPWAPSR